MRDSTLWRNSRRRDVSRQLLEDISDGMYALSLLRTRADDEITLSIDIDDVEQDLENCISTVERLQTAAENPVEEQSLVYVRTVGDASVSESSLDELGQLLRTALSEGEIDGDSYDTAYDLLAQIERYVKRQAERKTCF